MATSGPRLGAGANDGEPVRTDILRPEIAEQVGYRSFPVGEPRKAASVLPLAADDDAVTWRALLTP